MGRGVVSINGGVCAAMRMAAHTLAACRAPPKEPKPVVAGAESASARTVEVYFMVRCRWVGGEADKKESGLHLSDSDGRRKHVTSHTFLKLLFFRLSYESTHSRARRRALVRLARMAGLRSDPQESYITAASRVLGSNMAKTFERVLLERLHLFTSAAPARSRVGRRLARAGSTPSRRSTTSTRPRSGGNRATAPPASSSPTSPAPSR